MLRLRRVEVVMRMTRDGSEDDTAHGFHPQSGSLWRSLLFTSGFWRKLIIFRVSIYVRDDITLYRRVSRSSRCFYGLGTKGKGELSCCVHIHHEDHDSFKIHIASHHRLRDIE